MGWLYRYETKGIQSWILDSNMLRDLAGGSALVESLSRQAGEEARAVGATVLQSTSGAMTAEFPDKDKLEQFASNWPLKVAYLAPGLQLVQAWVPKEENFAALFPRLAAKRNRPIIPDLQAGPWVLRAGRSGRPAIPTPRGIRTNARQTKMDEAALAKERARGSDESGAVTGGYSWNLFEELVDRWPDQGVAVIHADGSGVGKRLLKLSSDQLRTFSEALREASKKATRAAIDTLPRTSNKIHARPIVSAGDDLTYIVPAAYARRFAETWLTTLEEATSSESLLQGKMYGGAGLVYIHKRYPFAQAYEMAEELCKAAKGQMKSKHKEVSVIAFRRITNSLVEDVTEHATGWVVGASPPNSLLDDLLAVVRQLPRGTLRNWLEHFDRESQGQANKLWARAREVADSALWSKLEEVLKSIGADPSNGTLGDSIEHVFSLKSKRVTPLRDALALRFLESVGGKDDEENP